MMALLEVEPKFNPFYTEDHKITKCEMIFTAYGRLDKNWIKSWLKSVNLHKFQPTLANFTGHKLVKIFTFTAVNFGKSIKIQKHRRLNLT